MRTRQRQLGLTGLMLAAAAWIVSPAQGSPYNVAVMLDNPTYYWTFDEAAGSALNCGTGAGGQLAQVGTAARAGSASTATGVSLGSAAQFDGSSAGWFYTNAAGGVSLQGGTMDSYAIELWTRADLHTAGRYLFEVGLSNTPSVIYNFNAAAMELFAAGNGRTGATGPTALTDGAWHHVVIGYKDNGAVGDTHTFVVDNGAPVTFANVSNRTFAEMPVFLVNTR